MAHSIKTRISKLEKSAPVKSLLAHVLEAIDGKTAGLPSTFYH